jgi:AraC family transcriptional regulator
VKATTRSYYDEVVRRAVARIAAGLDEALDLAMLAKEAAMAPLHFHHVFKGVVGETPLELHRRLRIERAAHQLLATERSVTTIAFDAGYETHESFTRAFRRVVGVAPSELRARAADGRGRRWQTEVTSPVGIHIDADGAPRVPEVFPARGEAMNVTTEDMPAMRVFAVRHVGPYHRISEAYEKLHQIAGRAGLLRSPPTMIALYHDDPETTPPDELTSDAAIVVDDKAPLPDGLTELRIPGGRYAKTTHAGPYATIGDTWSRLMGGWLPSSGQRLGPGVSFEIYRNTPMNAKPEDLRTDIYVPLA